jgi:chromosome segregation ATPase
MLSQENNSQASTSTTTVDGMLTLMDKNDVEEKIWSKSLKNAELSLEVDQLRLQLKEVAKRKDLMVEERAANMEMVVMLSRFVRSLQFQLLGGTSEEVNTEVLDGMASLEEQQISVMKKEREFLTKKCESLEQTIDKLKKKNTGREVRSMRSLRSMREQMDSIEADHVRLQNKCETGEEQIESMHLENARKEVQIKVLKTQIELLKGLRFSESQERAMEKSLHEIIKDDSIKERVKDKDTRLRLADGDSSLSSGSSVATGVTLNISASSSSDIEI